MDRPTNRMMISSADRSSTSASISTALRRLLEERLLPHERFRQRVVDDLRGPRWQLDPDFDLRSHLHHVALPAPCGHAALVELTSDLVSSPLDRDRPLWQLQLVDLADGGSALISRLHHCIGDGVALVRLLLALTDGEPGVAPRHVGQAFPEAHGLTQRARLAVLEARAAVRLLTLPPDSPTRLAGRLGVRKRVAWSAPLPLARLERRAHAAGATLNDVILAAAAGALRHWLDEHGGYPSGCEVRALVPVNLRSDSAGLGNRFGLVYLPLPLGVRDSRARLVELKRRLDAVKASPEAVVAFGVLGVFGRGRRLGGALRRRAVHPQGDAARHQCAGAVRAGAPGRPPPARGRGIRPRLGKHGRHPVAPQLRGGGHHRRRQRCSPHVRPRAVGERHRARARRPDAE